MTFLDDFFKRHPLLLCTLKKSADVFAKLVLYTSYAVCGVAALVLAVYGMFALCSAIANPVRAIVDAVWNWTLPSQMFAAVTGVLAAIPWYAYVGIAVVAAIPVYSLLWCIARELTEEDMKLSDLEGGIITVTVIIFGFCAVVQETTWGITHAGVEYAGDSFISMIVVPLGIIGAGCIVGGVEAIYILYLHYRKRIKEERK